MKIEREPGHQVNLYSKNGAALVQIADRLLQCAVGDRIESIPALSTSLGVSIGTVSKCLDILERSGAITLQKKGHLGSFIQGIDYRALWNIGGMGSLFCVMPLPYTRRYEALASALSAHFATLNIPFQIAYMRGASVRNEGLRSGRYDLAVMSLLAAERIVETDGSLRIIGRFGKGSYVEKHVLITQKESVRLKKVAVDDDSVDQAILTDLYLRSRRVMPTVVHAPYGQTIELIAQGKVDGAIWNYDYIAEHKVAMSTTDLGEIPEVEKATESVLVCSTENSARSSLLRQDFDAGAVAELQRKCLANEIAIQF